MVGFCGVALFCSFFVVFCMKTRHRGRRSVLSKLGWNSLVCIFLNSIVRLLLFCCFVSLSLWYKNGAEG